MVIPLSNANQPEQVPKHNNGRTKNPQPTNPNTWVRVNILCKVCVYFQGFPVAWGPTASDGTFSSISGWFCRQKFLTLFLQCCVVARFAFVWHPKVPSWFETCLYRYFCLRRRWRRSLRLYPLWQDSCFVACVVPSEGWTCSCRPHGLTCLPSLWTPALVGRANNTISFCTNYLMPTTGPVSQLFSLHAHAHTHKETHTEGEREARERFLRRP